MAQPDDNSKIVIFEGALCRPQTTGVIALTIEMLTTLASWKSSLALLGMEVFAASTCLLLDMDARHALVVALITGVGGVALHGLAAKVASKRWHKATGA